MAGIIVTDVSKFALDSASAMGLRLTSGYRSPEHDKKVGGTGKGDHTKGTAYDFAGTRNQMLNFADKMWKSGKFTKVFFDNKSYKTGAYIADHMDHVHLSWDGSKKGSSSPIIEEGDKGSIVKAIQRLLGMINIDGWFGSATDKAVKEFQEKHGLTKDGKVGAKTWEKLTGGGSVFFSR